MCEKGERSEMQDMAVYGSIIISVAVLGLEG